ncbi:hypothetical protein [Streptomyces sp. NPDC056660]|uniref:hypothetical protein n=1 Tax=Streptomyces sp. NPDC056660 TaxID=3345897 RepID=UPI0036B2E985
MAPVSSGFCSRQEILYAVAEGLARGNWDGPTAGGWHERTLRLRHLVEQARSAIGWSRESMRGNHRGRGPRGVSPPGRTYDDALAVLDHVAVHLAGVTRTVWEIAGHHDEAERPGPRITRPYADFLHHAGRTIGLYGRTRFAETDPEPGLPETLHEAAEELRQSLEELHHRLPGTVRDTPGTLATHGALLAHARRLADHSPRSDSGDGDTGSDITSRPAAVTGPASGTAGCPAQWW